MRLLLLLLHALQVAAVVKTSTFTKEKCKTKLGLFSLEDVPTTIKVLKETLTTSTCKKGKCPVTTVTTSDEAVTTTITDTTSTLTTLKTATTVLITKFNTDTITQTFTASTTVTATVTETGSTVSTPTSTVAAPSGFVPLAQEPGYVPRKKRSVEEPKSSRYPKSVTCVKTIKKVIAHCVKKPCRHTRTTTVIIPASTSTVRTTTTSTSTVTSFTTRVTSTVTATVTTTQRTTTTETSTETETTTSISTSFAPEATMYAACDTNNIVSTANGGHGITRLQGGASSIITSDTTNYNCCVSCQNAVNCNGFYAFPDFDTGVFKCILNIEPDCEPGQENGITFFTQANQTRFTIGNGPCGGYQNGGEYNPDQGDQGN